MEPEITAFNQFPINRQLLNAIAEAGLLIPTPIQGKAIPQILAGHDIKGIAPTGTGKTAAYLIPLMARLGYPQGDQPRALILAPTRELTIQIQTEAQKLSVYSGIRSVAIYGGTGKKKQLEQLSQGADLLIATPGRFMDLYLAGDFNARLIKTLILDEADKMMDMGFLPQIRAILEVIPAKKRQNLLFSATLPSKVEELSQEFLEFPVKIEIRPQATPADTIKQWVYYTPNIKTKINLLEHLLKEDTVFSRVIIFCKTKKSADDVHKFIHRKVDPGSRVMHANKNQNTRIHAIESFRKGEYRVLVCTDVASRGLDISMVSHVINFDVPMVYEDYVHRIGRTGRASQSGTAITLINKPDEYHLGRIEEIIRQKIPVMNLPPDVPVAETEFREQQMYDREADRIRQKNNPEFKGAFHKKKKQRYRK